MTRMDILSLALNCGAHEKYEVVYMDFDDLEKFFKEAYNAGIEQERKEFAVHAVDIARRVAKEENEACAKLCEEQDSQQWSEVGEYNSGYGYLIRKRGMR